MSHFVKRWNRPRVSGQDHGGAVQVAQGDQRKRAVDGFIFLHGLFCAAETLIVIIMKQDHAALFHAGKEEIQAGADRGVQVCIQTDQCKGFRFQACCRIRKIPGTKICLLREW